MATPTMQKGTVALPEPAQFELSMNEETKIAQKTSTGMVGSCYYLCYDLCRGSQGLLA